ncbi:MAG: ATP-dependent zinc metalloprotease FtsH [Pirellulaceae bacterium]|nr:ATP-dependent zinc metalloprotease FtsH [Pirellulaceae bacterium]
MQWLKYLSLGFLGLVILTVFYMDNTVTLAYPQFKELVEQTPARDSSDSPAAVDELNSKKSGKIILPATKTSKNRREFSRLKDVALDDSYIQGKVRYRELDADDKVVPGTEFEAIPFRVANDGNAETNRNIRELLTEAKIDWRNNPGPGLFAQYLPFIILMLLPLVLIGLMMRKMGGIGSPMQFGRSRGKLYAQQDTAVTFNDVAGIDEAVEEVREVVDFLQNPDKYQKLGGRIPKGVLLVGPPGTGKTLLAKAIAGEAGVPFYSLSGSDFVEMFVGVGAARVRDMFQQATAKAPCIIFIDELDALGKSRAGNVPGSHDEREQTLNALLVEMDGFEANNGVIVMAATNRPETLDSALLRPGRFDRNVLVDRPDKAGREEILKVHVKNVKLGTNVDLRQTASITPGFVGADLANLVNEAALLAARKGKTSVGQEEFNDGVERVTAGLEKKKRLMNESEKKRVAYHEAGHALVAYSLPDTDPVHKVSIIPRGVAALGYTMQRPEGDRYLMTQPELEAQMQVLLAGTLTEEIIFRDISTGAQNDLERATAIARGMVMEYGMSRLGRINFRESNRSPFLMSMGGDGRSREYSEQTAREIDQEVKRLIDESVVKTRLILSERRAALEAIAQRLIEVEVVDATDLKSLVDATLDGPRVVPGTSTSTRKIEPPNSGLSKDSPIAQS